MRERWGELEWGAFAKEFWRLRQLPDNKDRTYLGPIYWTAQKILPAEIRRTREYFSAFGKLTVFPRIKKYIDSLDAEAGLTPGVSLEQPVERRIAEIVEPEEAQALGIDYEKLANLVIAKLRPEVEKYTETFLDLRLEERFKNFKPTQNTGGLPAHMLDQRKVENPGQKNGHKLKVTIFGVEEKNKNTSRFNYLNHALDIRLWHGTEPHAAKHAADLSDLTLIASNNPDLPMSVIKEIKKSDTKFVFTSGGLSSVDAALQTFATTKGLRFTVPEHPSHQH